MAPHFKLLPLFAVLAHGLSLSNFAPFVPNLPKACNDVYVANINSCTANEFKTTLCSAACVDAVVNISTLVRSRCGSVDVPETSVLGLILLGRGIQTICSNVRFAAPSSSLSSSSTARPPPPPPSSTVQPASSSTSSRASTRATTTSQDSPNTTSGSVTVITSSVSTELPSATETQTSSETVQSNFLSSTTSRRVAPTPAGSFTIQRSNTDSGGGSPFDVQAGAVSKTSASSSPCSSWSPMALLAALLLNLFFDAL